MQASVRPTSVAVQSVLTGNKDQQVTKTLETGRVAYVGKQQRLAFYRSSGIVGTGLYAAVCTVAYETRPDHKVASGDAKQRAKLISKALRASLAAEVPEDVESPAFGPFVSPVARALAVHGLDGIVATLDAGNGEPEFFGKTFIEQRDKAASPPEDAPTALARFAKGYASHAGSRIPPGTGDQEQVKALARACLMALGMITDDAGFDAALGPDGAQAKSDLRREIARKVADDNA